MQVGFIICHNADVGVAFAGVWLESGGDSQERERCRDRSGGILRFKNGVFPAGGGQSY